jgi:hypothetical protein
LLPNQEVSTVLNVAFQCSLTVMTGTVKLSHFSVKEYLLSNRVEEYFCMNEEASHSKISKISLTYLLQFHHSFEPLTEAMLDSLPLARYAAQNWIDDAESGGMDTTLLKLVLRLFVAETAFLTKWIWIWNIDVPWWHKQDLSMDKAEVHSPLYYASLVGMEEVSYYLLEQGMEVNVKGGEYGNALQVASFNGHEGIVNVLLENGAEVNAQEGEYGNALQAASFNGHEGIVNSA